MNAFITAHWLDITTTLLGLAYILLEYKANIWLWLVGFVMQALDIVLYYQKGLYADCGMEFYYIAMTVYGFTIWRFGKKRKADNDEVLPITHFKASLILPWAVATVVIWGALYWFLAYCTDSSVPVADAFTTALSFRRHLGAGTQVSGAMAHLDSGRRGYLRSLLLQGHPVQSLALRTLCRHRRSGIHEVAADDESLKDHDGVRRLLFTPSLFLVYQEVISPTYAETIFSYIFIKAATQSDSVKFLTGNPVSCHHGLVVLLMCPT
jgi:nicotinamide mononucleotide transporter PnuC